MRGSGRKLAWCSAVALGTIVPVLAPSSPAAIPPSPVRAHAASLGCPPSGSAPAVPDPYAPAATAVLACIGTTPVTGGQFAHRFAIYRLRTVPHRFGQGAALTATMTDLIAEDWLAGEAHARHVAVTNTAVRRRLATLARTTFRRKGSFRRYLAKHGMTPADFSQQLRTELLTSALRQRVQGHGSRRAKQRAYARFRSAFVRMWKGRTSCLLPYLVASCGSVLDTASPGTGPSGSPTPPVPPAPPRVHPVAAVGRHPTGLVVDTSTNTVYVANGGDDTLTMLDTQTCNATVTSGCASARLAPIFGSSPVGVALDDASHTLYTGNALSDTVSLLDAATCNAAGTSGCVSTQDFFGVDGGPELLAIDPASHAIYVPNAASNTISVEDGTSCNAVSDTCVDGPPTASVGTGPEILAVDGANHTVYVANSGTDTVSLIDAQACNGTTTSGCATIAPTVTVDLRPLGIAIDPTTDTIYVSNAGSDTVSVIAGATCNAATTASCVVATVPVGHDPRGEAIDVGTHTLYVADAGANAVSVLDTSACNAGQTAGCGATPVTAAVGASPRRVAVDPRTHAVYVSNANAGSVSLIDGASCDAADTSGC